MKITCTAEEKETMVKTLAKSRVYPCVLVNSNCLKYTACDECVEKNIEWEVTP